MSRWAIVGGGSAQVSFSVPSLPFLSFQPVCYGYGVDEQFPGNKEREGDVRMHPAIDRSAATWNSPGTVHHLRPGALGRLYASY